MVEHDPVVTVGRQGKRTSLLATPESLEAQGVGLFEIERGGDVTYHGPGQVVVYPIMRLDRFREVVPLVRAIESAVLKVCDSYGIAGERWSEHAGVWVGTNCICAVGLAVKRMTTLHGLALNASTRLDYDRLINPCGLTDRESPRSAGRPGAMWASPRPRIPCWRRSRRSSNAASNARSKAMRLHRLRPRRRHR